MCWLKLLRHMEQESAGKWMHRRWEEGSCPAAFWGCVGSVWWPPQMEGADGKWK